ncbi:hypothetical protein [Legionella parisiensis]|uniref:Substrate of the Dot/Icm secretion system n=1 Tax=Legionella parisiensis TaxID=45071 RepID=A0A1E5JQ95_9GAMM|nr:hypothetical protein [Legionella parisiensis]KTD40277.1 substrate of the Dot/Icm secretion system [Legionella parisiensis]OEH46712.1 hypothetical protein lpari_02180 [Legionella parisiensis]STX77611.1 Dot/Icm secretion system substrate [Legionella parisiensis]
MSAQAPVELYDAPGGVSPEKYKKKMLPSRDDLLKAMQCAEKSPELARYLRQQVHQIVENSIALNKNPESKALAHQVLKAVNEFTQFVEYKFSQESQVWSGKPPKSSFDQMQSKIAEKAGATISEKNFPSIRFDFGISNEGHFVRGYGSTEKGAPPLEEETVDSLDRLFNAWLANNHQVITRDGFFFKNEKGAERQLTGEEVEAIMADSAKDFKEYLKKSGVETELVSRQREYPGEHRLEETKKAAAQKAVDRVIKEAELEEERPEPEQPQNVGPG